MNENKGAVAVTGPKEVTEHTARVGRDRLDEWSFGVCSIECQDEPGESTLQNTVDQTRQVKTIPPNSPRYSHDSLGQCESSIKEAEKPIRVFISHAWRADPKCDSDRQVVWTNTQRTVNAEEQMSLFKWMNNNLGEVAKFAELSGFRSITKQSKLAEQWKDAHWVGKLKHVDKHLLVINRFDSLSRSRSKTSSC